MVHTTVRIEKPFGDVRVDAVVAGETVSLVTVDFPGGMTFLFPDAEHLADFAQAMAGAVHKARNAETTACARLKAPCRDCNGTGIVRVRVSPPGGPMVQCGWCGGSGVEPAEARRV